MQSENLDQLNSLLKRGTKEATEATGHLIGNKSADEVTRASKTSSKNNSEANEEEMLKETYIYPQK